MIIKTNVSIVSFVICVLNAHHVVIVGDLNAQRIVRLVVMFTNAETANSVTSAILQAIAQNAVNASDASDV
ncbi:hypothetical protein FACS189449_10180 [Alphaproteobacteria bacterium]|nr:hypothetical protein FACS189449_10180 [Alphaproteobacteria bacterium]